MSVTVVLLAGPIATGKTTVADQLGAVWPAQVVKVREALSQVLGIDARDRPTLQREGADLDRRTRGAWLRDYVEERHPAGSGPVVVDAMRTRLQTLPILDGIVDARLVFVSAHESTRRARYALGAAHDTIKASVDFDTAMHHPTESEVQHLAALSHLQVETDDLTPAEVTTLVVDRLHLHAGHA